MGGKLSVRSCASNRSSLGLAVTSVFLLLSATFFAVQEEPDSRKTTVWPVFGYDVQGVLYNRLTGERLGDVSLDCGDRGTTSDADGQFRLKSDWREVKRCKVWASGFETQYLEAQSGARLSVSLVPDPTWTVQMIVGWEEARQFGKQYDLLHPDVRRSWTREEFTRVLTLTEGRRIVGAEYAAPVYLDQWDYYGESYENVAVVPTWLILKRNGQQLRHYWEAHLVKVGGIWHWFREE